MLDTIIKVYSSTSVLYNSCFFVLRVSHQFPVFCKMDVDVLFLVLSHNTCNYNYLAVVCVKFPYNQSDIVNLINKAQAESIMAEIKAKQEELERLNSQQRMIETGTMEVNTRTRNRFGRNFAAADNYSQGYDDFKGKRQTGLRIDSRQRRILVRSALVVYILALHIIVFVRISF